MWNLQRFSKKTAIICEDGIKLTYGELDTLQSQCVRFMSQRRKLVLLIVDNSMESIILYISCIQNKIPIMLMEDSMRRNELESIIMAYQPFCVWMPNGYMLVHNYSDFGVFRGYMPIHILRGH